MAKKVIIIGGNYGTEKDQIRSSKIVKLLADQFDVTQKEVYNGGHLDELPKQLSGLSIWMPNILNEHEKDYPTKSIGTCLVVSKVVRSADDLGNKITRRTRVDGKMVEKPPQHKYTQAVARIFKMNGNAVIAIEDNKGVKTFTLIDALGNVWVSTKDLFTLSDAILKFYEWHKGQKRRSIKHNRVLDMFMETVRTNAKKIMNSSGDRYFGNCSTRCSKSFPSVRVDGNVFLFSPRNTDKTELELSDMVLVNDGGVVGTVKPSVDSPVQIELYHRLPNINFMIHGHAFIPNVPTTKHYYPCGDMREVDAIMEQMNEPNTTEAFDINLKGHGYLVGMSSIDDLIDWVKKNTPVMEPFRFKGVE